MAFRDRHHAGEVLADLLSVAGRPPGDVVLALPRGGVPVAARVAERFGVPLDVFVVRKLGVPGHEELAFGAVASGGARVLNEDVIEVCRLDDETIERATTKALEVVAERERRYRGDRDAVPIAGRRVLLVDDGLATGASMRVAVLAVRELGADHVTVAVPVGPAPTVEALRRDADNVVCVLTPEPFEAVGRWYRDFDQLSDRDVRSVLHGEVPA